MQYTVCVCSTLFAYAVHCLCMQYIVCVCSKLFVYSVHCLCMQYTVCVCSTLFVNAVHCLCMQTTYLIILLLSNSRIQLDSPVHLEPEKKLTRHLLKLISKILLIRNLVKAPKQNSTESPNTLKVACLLLF